MAFGIRSGASGSRIRARGGVGRRRAHDPQAPAGAERSASFMLTGGLVALHAEGRDRDAIWQALERKEVYGTSGPRILLWFDLLDPPSEAGVASRLPMGGSTVMLTNPRFRVHAVGALEQRPGCPDSVEAALGAQRLAELCMGECYHPSDRASSSSASKWCVFDPRRPPRNR